MTGSNHVVTGALIAVIVPEPAIAIPLAFASHFVLDALPHFGYTEKHSWLHRNFKYILAADATVMIIFLALLIGAQPVGWVLMLVCALVAVSPDILWLPYYLADRRGEPLEPSKIAKLSKQIQWAEHPWGMAVEVVWLVVVAACVLQAAT